MCGIFGLVLSGREAMNTSCIAEINAMLRHRGPDGFGLVSTVDGSDGKALQIRYNDFSEIGDSPLLLHRRLAIIDLRDIATQPFVDVDAGLSVLVNGEIYNFKTLREELISLGHQFSTCTDSEVIFCGYREWGERVVDRLEGMFAFAIMDLQAGVILLGRDRFGIKPLFISHTRQGLVFSSELSPVRRMRHELGESELMNAQAYYDFLRHGLTEFDDEGLFKGIASLRPGHMARYNLCEHTLKISCYARGSEQELDISYDEAVECTRELFISAVERHLVADVPVATTLSGGIDSSAILGVMVNVLKVRPRAFTFVSPDRAQSEESWAERAIEGLDVDLQKITAEPPDFDRLIAVIDRQGEPFDGASILAQNTVHEAVAAEGFKVVLDGQGADELLAGYMPHVGWHLGDQIRSGRIGTAFTTGRNFWRNDAPMSLIGLGLIDRSTPPVVSQWLRSLRGIDAFPSHLDRGWFADRGVRTLSSRRAELLDQGSLRGRLNYALYHESIPHLLRYADRNAMMHSIENRVPFLDYPFVDFVSRLPGEYCVSRGGWTKAVFRDAMRGLVQEDILGRRDKVGFTAPEKIWYEPHKERFSEVIFDRQTIACLPGVNWPIIEKAFKEGKLCNKILWRLFNIAIIRGSLA